MNENNAVSEDPSGSGLIRFGGVAMLVGLAIHIIVNMVLKQMPPVDPSLEELRSYLLEEKKTWAIVHGVRYIAFVCIALFAAALFARTCCSRTKGWAVLGLLGATMMLANAMITNGIETFVFLDFKRLSGNAEIFTAFFYATRVLFTAEMTAWAILIFGFSAAGWYSRRLPKWLAAFGIIPAVTGVLSGVFVVSILNDGSAGVVIEIAAMTGLAWFASASVYMVLRGAR